MNYHSIPSKEPKATIIPILLYKLEERPDTIENVLGKGCKSLIPLGPFYKT